jgi:hypothetical protein
MSMIMMMMMMLLLLLMMMMIKMRMIGSRKRINELQAETSHLTKRSDSSTK